MTYFVKIFVSFGCLHHIKAMYCSNAPSWWFLCCLVDVKTAIPVIPKLICAIEMVTYSIGRFLDTPTYCTLLYYVHYVCNFVVTVFPLSQECLLNMPAHLISFASYVHRCINHQTWIWVIHKTTSIDKPHKCCSTGTPSIQRPPIWFGRYVIFSWCPWSPQHYLFIYCSVPCVGELTNENT